MCDAGYLSILGLQEAYRRYGADLAKGVVVAGTIGAGTAVALYILYLSIAG